MALLVFDSLDGAEVGTAWVGCHVLSLLVQYLVDEGDRNRSLPDGGSHALDTPGPYVAGG
jgi:hypothetical protein